MNGKTAAAAAALLALIAPWWQSARAQDAPPPKSLTVLNYITGWDHDVVGYHPAVFMVLENTSGRDLSETTIHFQGRFTDLQTADVSIGRREMRKGLKPHQQISLSLEAQEGYELPFEVQQWPRIEAKIMCRVGDVGDEGTETLMIAKVDQETRTQDSAFDLLNQSTSYAPKSPMVPVRPQQSPGGDRHSSKRHDAPPPPQKPLRATAGRVGEPPPATSAVSWLNAKNLPGLGDDFYKFEQRFGLPREFDAKHGEWTWARYEQQNTGAEIIAGAHDRRGAVDVIIVSLPKSSTDEVALSALARNLAGQLRSQSLSGADKSVRYLPSGRLELVSRKASGYRVLTMSPTETADSRTLLILSRSQQDVEQLLASQSQKISLLKCVQFLEAKN